MAWQSLHDIYSTKVLSPAKQESAEVKLSDVYSEQIVRDNYATTLEPRRKEWKSLSDVYTSGARGNYINEALVAITVGEGDSKTFNLADVYVREILQKAAFHQETMGEIIKTWVESGGWKGKDLGVITNFIIGEINQLNKDGIIDAQGNSTAVDFSLIKEDIVQLINTKETNKSFTKALASETRNFNYLQMLTRPDLQVLQGAFLQNIYDFAFSKSKTVNVGPGEVAATLFTEATAAEKGDLLVGDKLIEIKKQGGIVGQHGPGERLLKFMSGHVDSNYIDTLRDREINKLKDLIRNNEEIIQNAITQLKAERDGVNAPEVKKKPLTKDRKKLLELLELLLAKTEFKFKEIEEFVIPAKMTLDSAEFNSLDDIKRLIFTIKDIKEGKVIKTNSLFFAKAENSPSLRTVSAINYLLYTGILPDDDDISDIISDIVRQSKLKPLQKIGALSIVDYQLKENFDYIILTEKNYRTIVIGPFIKDNSVQNIQMVFDSISDINFKMSGGRDTGKFEMFLGPAPADDGSENGSAAANTPATQPTVSLPAEYNPDASFKNLPTV
jgi:hypothetical protein